MVSLKGSSLQRGTFLFEDGKEIPIEIETKQPTQVTKPIDGMYPKELTQGKFGKLIINDITTVDHTTTVKFTAEGKAPNFQAKNPSIQDDQGEIIRVTNRDVRRNEQNPNEFIVEIEAFDSNRQYHLRTAEFENIEFDETMMFKIELEK